MKVGDFVKFKAIENGKTISKNGFVRAIFKSSVSIDTKITPLRWGRIRVKSKDVIN